MHTTTDPIILCLIIREDLHMPVSKICSEAANAVQNLMLRYFKMQILHSKKKWDILSKHDVEHTELTSEWLDHSATKIIKCANEDEWVFVKAEFSKDCFVMKDAELNETIIGFWPAHESQMPIPVMSLKAL